MRGGRGGGMGAPRFRGGGRGFMAPPPVGGPGPDYNRGGPRGGGPDNRPRAPMRFRNWQGQGQDQFQGINEPETFAETPLPDGRCYYYNTRTRETMWERPEGPGVRIIRHDEVVWPKGGGPPQGQGPPGDQFDHPHGHMGPGQSYPGSGNMHDDQSQPGRDYSGHTSAPGTSMLPPGANSQEPPHRPMYSQPGTQGPPMQRFPPPGQNQHIMPPAPGVSGPPPRMDGFHPRPHAGPMGPPPMTGMPPPGFMHNHPPTGPPPNGNPPFGMPPPGAGQFPNPNYTGIPPPWGFPPMVPPAGVPPPTANPSLPQVDPVLVALAAEYTEHISPEGTPYYFSTKTQTSVWEKPKVLIDLEAAKLQVQQRASMLAAQQTQAAAATSSGGNSQSEQDSPDKSKPAKRVEKKVEKCRPISSTPVSGTAWCVVWTGDRRVFFYNPANKTSVWERPQELLGRLDVDEMVRVCPPAKIKKVEATSTTSPSLDTVDKKAKAETTAATSAVTFHPAREDDTHPPGEDREPAEPPIKRLRTSSDDGPLSTQPKVDSEAENISEKTEEAKSGLQELIETKDALREMTALEAEAKASRDRATIPMEVRLKQFREMLIETNVSAFSTWEKELHKIVFDQRYLLLTSNERKKAFDRYVEEIVEEERKEKQNRLKETKEKFFQFLSEIKISTKMNYNDFSQRYGRDERFRGVEKSRDRETFFMEYLKMVQKKEKEERCQRKEKEREDFLRLLHEKVKDYHATLPELRKKLESDARYQVVEPEERDELFRKFQRRLRQEYRLQEQEKKRERALARARKRSERDSKGSTSGDESKGKAGPSGTEEISEEEEGCITDDSDDDARGERERQERAEQSIREREKEVQRSLATHLRDRDKEREFHRHEEAVQELQALFTDLIRTPEIVWREAKRVIKKDPRWKFVTHLPREEMEEIFKAHVEQIARKKLQRFKDLLDEHHVTPRTKWRDLYLAIKDDPRCVKFSTSERKCQREFEEYVRDMQAHMKVEFRELLKETKMLNYRTLETLKLNPNMMREIESHLENDRRYLQLDKVKSERERLLNEYLEDLESKGPPPPPTASEPTRRK